MPRIIFVTTPRILLKIFLFNFAGDVESGNLYFKSVRLLELFLLPHARRSNLIFSANIKDVEDHIRNHASVILEIFFSRSCWISRDRKTLFQGRPIPRTFLLPHARRSNLIFSANIKNAEGHIRNRAPVINENYLISSQQLCWDREILFQVFASLSFITA